MSRHERIFKSVDMSHVERACERAIEEGIPPRRRGRSSFILYAGEELPVKYVMGLAYEIATGERLEPSDYHGGQPVLRIALDRGMTCRYDGTVVSPTGDSVCEASPDRDSAGREVEAPSETNAEPSEEENEEASESDEVSTTLDEKHVSSDSVWTSVATPSDRSADDRASRDSRDSDDSDELRVVTACISGSHGHGGRQSNDRRLDLLGDVVESIRARHWQPDILLLPGGFLSAPCYVGDTSPDDRTRYREHFHIDTIRRASRELDALVTYGIDGRRRAAPRRLTGDQLHLAVDDDGLVGLGRKVWPTEEESPRYAPNLEDYGTDERLAAFERERRAMLCSCYDMFGCNQTGESSSKYLRCIKQWHRDGNIESTASADRRKGGDLRRATRRWYEHVQGATLGLAAIHHFTRSGRGSGKGYWHKNGIRMRSQHFGGGLTFGAAHFEPPLPSPDRCLFAARDGEDLQPSDHATVDHERDTLLRLFEAEPV